MISDERIEELIQPVIARQDDLNVFVLTTIAARIKDNSNLNGLKKHKRTHKDLRAIDRAILDCIDFEAILIPTIMREIALADYNAMEKAYSHANVSYIKLKNNADVKQIVDNKITQAVSNYKDTVKNPKFVIGSAKYPKNLKPFNIPNTYNLMVNQADAGKDMTLPLTQLADSGLREVIIDESGRRYSRKLDIGVGNDLLNDIRDMRQSIQNEVGKQTYADGVEISVHAFPALDHAPVQGHQFLQEEFEKLQNGEDFTDIDGNAYAGFERAIGEWNCRHFTFSVIVGVTPQNYTNKQLEEILDKNEEGYILPDGKHLTMYECSQRQRAYERKLRALKEGYVTAKAADNINLMERYKTRLLDTRKKYINFSRACGLALRLERTNVKGYQPQ